MASVVVARIGTSDGRSSTTPERERTARPAAGSLDSQQLSATFGHVADATVAALLLVDARKAHARRSMTRVAIAAGDPSRAQLEAIALVSVVNPGDIVLTQTAVDQLERWLPDGMALVPLAPGEEWSDPSAPTDAWRLVSAESVIAHRLPAVPTSFIGRSSELAELKDVVGTHQLVTLSGPPGSGKTRLAIELARR
ncbi:MAG: ATP-binding protein, partial [Chloroflexota bacterium]|nr:ATP-binding protein [Chloroflexota bacterium]